MMVDQGVYSRVLEDEMSQRSQPQVTEETQRLLALARSKGYAINPDDVRRRFGREPLTAQMVLEAAATANQAPYMEVTATTTTAELDAFLFGG